MNRKRFLYCLFLYRCLRMQALLLLGHGTYICMKSNCLTVLGELFVDRV